MVATGKITVNVSAKRTLLCRLLLLIASVLSTLKIGKEMFYKITDYLAQRGMLVKIKVGNNKWKRATMNLDLSSGGKSQKNGQI